MPVGPSRREVRQAGDVREALFVEHDLFRKPDTAFGIMLAWARRGEGCERWKSGVGADYALRLSNAKPVSNRRLKNT
jgi:hypothetical protein